MIKEFPKPKKEFPLGGGNESKVLDLRAMDQQELSLSLSGGSTTSSSLESDVNTRRKRKQTWDEHTLPASIDLQLNGPLPLDWEHCLYLQWGKMHCLNRKSLKKSCISVKEQKLDLELNMSTTFPSSEEKAYSTTTRPEEAAKKHAPSGNNMVALVACVNCHLLVMLCKSSPSCPNCGQYAASSTGTASSCFRQQA